jgi:hypothetical protein
MDNIVEPNSAFDYSKLSLAHPSSIQGGAYFTKILYEGKPLYIQTPKSYTKQGFLKNGKKITCELMFENTDEDIIHWLENLETKCQQLIFEKSGDWFQNSLELSDIETAFNSPIKVYKSGKFYLLRSNVKINSLTNVPLIKIYNENESPVSLDDINCDSNIISILEIQGIKFTSRNFQIDIEIKQMMLLNKDELLENCLIKKSKRTTQEKQESKKAPVLEIPLVSVKTEIDEHDESNTNEEGELSENLELLSESILSEIDSTTTHDEEIKVESEPEKEANPIEQIEELDLENITMTKKYNDVAEENESIAENNNSIRDLDNLIHKTIDKNSDNGSNELTEIDFDNLENDLETITLKKPNEVYYEMYKEAREKAKKAKKEALLAFLEAKNIKQTYLLDELDSSDESGFSEEEESEKENFY